MSPGGLPCVEIEKQKNQQNWLQGSNQCSGKKPQEQRDWKARGKGMRKRKLTAGSNAAEKSRKARREDRPLG